MSTIKLSIVVPCYNEAENLTPLLTAYNEVIKRDDIEIVLVNNGSTDNSATVLETIAPQYQRFLKVVTIPINQGYGYGIVTGLKACTGEFIGWTHGDLQTPPRDIIRALAIIEADTAPQDLFVKGNRTGRPFFDVFFTFGMSVFETLYLQTWLYDINAQPNIFHRSFFTEWNNVPDDFSLDLYAFYKAKRKKLRVKRFSVPFLARQHGVSSWNTGLKSKWKFIKRTLIFSTKLKQKL